MHLKNMHRKRKLQSAMEYLMTYGWAILIIAVVLGALFQLGVFNSSSFAPRAPPGSCQVFRPGGPLTTTNINLMGVCTGQLPQYVASLASARSSSISFGTTGFPTGASSRTMTAWIYPISLPGQMGIAGYGGSGTNTGYTLGVESTGFLSIIQEGNTQITTMSPVLNSWNFVAVKYDGTQDTLYLGTASQTASPSPLTTGTSLGGWIGTRDSGGSYFNGQLANIQLYNITLTANQIQALYLEGIGGAPMKLQNIVGWWPLNGNANDYGGNNNNGVPYNSVTFTSQYGK